MRLPISKESAFIIGIGLIGLPVAALIQSRWQAAQQAAALQPDPNARRPKKRVYDKE